MKSPLRALVLVVAAFAVVAGIVVVTIVTIRYMAQPTTRGAGPEITITKKGSGARVQKGDRVAVHYVGTLIDGTTFDSSRGGEPYAFVVGAGDVIEGWDLGVLGMQVGEVRALRIPPELAYGERGIGPIPPRSTLLFEIELILIESSS